MCSATSASSTAIPSSSGARLASIRATTADRLSSSRAPRGPERTGHLRSRPHRGKAPAVHITHDQAQAARAVATSYRSPPTPGPWEAGRCRTDNLTEPTRAGTGGRKTSWDRLRHDLTRASSRALRSRIQAASIPDPVTLVAATSAAITRRLQGVEF